jgi:LPS O-antigen subunit length determinant protein (WzzB/FepE family)
MTTWKVEVSGDGIQRARRVLEDEGLTIESEPPQGTTGKSALTVSLDAGDSTEARHRVQSALDDVDEVSVVQAARK